MLVVFTKGLQAITLKFFTESALLKAIDEYSLLGYAVKRLKDDNFDICDDVCMCGQCLHHESYWWNLKFI